MDKKPVLCLKELVVRGKIAGGDVAVCVAPRLDQSPGQQEEHQRTLGQLQMKTVEAVEACIGGSERTVQN